MNMLLINHLVEKSIEKPKDLSALGVDELWLLFNIYQKKYFEHLSNHGEFIDLQKSHYHDEYTNLFNSLESPVNHHIKHIIEKSTLFNPNQSFLYWNKNVDPIDIEYIRKLITYGYFSLIPGMNNAAALMQCLSQDNDATKAGGIPREQLSLSPILIHIPLAVNIDPNMAQLHFGKESSKYRRYKSSILAANRDAYSIKGMYDLYGILCLLDNVLCKLIEIVRSGVNNPTCREFKLLLDAFKLTNDIDNRSNMHVQDKIERHMYSRLNFGLGWFFNIKKGSVAERMEIIGRLTRGGEHSIEIVNFIRAKKLLRDHI